VREIGDVTIPARVRRTHLYRSLVDETLRFVIEKVGEVKGTYPVDDDATRGFLLRRTAGNGIELAGILAFRASPVWVLAALADISGARPDPRDRRYSAIARTDGAWIEHRHRRANS
jgi:hypothetical protein